MPHARLICSHETKQRSLPSLDPTPCQKKNCILNILEIRDEERKDWRKMNSQPHYSSGPNLWEVDCPVPHLPLNLVFVDSFSSCDTRFHSMALPRLVSFWVCLHGVYVFLVYGVYQGKSGLFDLSLVSTLVLAGFRCGLMGLSDFPAELIVRHSRAFLVRHSGPLVVFLLSL